MLRIRILLTVVIAVCAGGCGESISERAARDDVVAVAADDPAMLSAFKRAKQTLTEFISTADNPPAGYSDFSVKVRLRKNDEVEYFWVTPFAHETSTFSGTLANDGELLEDRKVGDRISFPEEDVVDWSYIDASGVMHGNFTACALLTHEDPKDAAAFRKEYGLTCADS